MHLEQLNLSYLADEDRILLRIGFSADDGNPEKTEVQFYITRRMLQMLWPAMMEAMGTYIRLHRPEAAFASDDLMNMEHQDAVERIEQSGNFAQSYDSKNRKSLNGERPFLIETVNFHLNPDAPFWIQIVPQGGGSVDLHLDTALLHGFCKLLIDTEQKSGWDLDLSLPKTHETPVPSHLLN